MDGNLRMSSACGAISSLDGRRLPPNVPVIAHADDVWRVIGDFAMGPVRMAPGLVVDTRTDGDCRTVTFSGGTVTRERFIASDEQNRRIAYSIVGDSLHPGCRPQRIRRVRSSSGL